MDSRQTIHMLLLYNTKKSATWESRTRYLRDRSRLLNVNAQPVRPWRIIYIYIFYALHTNRMIAFLERTSANSDAGFGHHQPINSFFHNHHLDHRPPSPTTHTPTPPLPPMPTLTTTAVVVPHNRCHPQTADMARECHVDGQCPWCQTPERDDNDDDHTTTTTTDNAHTHKDGSGGAPQTAPPPHRWRGTRVPRQQWFSVPRMHARWWAPPFPLPTDHPDQITPTDDDLAPWNDDATQTRNNELTTRNNHMQQPCAATRTRQWRGTTRWPCDDDEPMTTRNDHCNERPHTNTTTTRRPHDNDEPMTMRNDHMWPTTTHEWGPSTTAHEQQQGSPLPPMLDHPPSLPFFPPFPSSPFPSSPLSLYHPPSPTLLYPHSL